MFFCFKRGVGVRSGGPRAFETAFALLIARVWELYGGDGAVSTRTGLLSAGVDVRWGVAGSLSNEVGYKL